MFVRRTHELWYGAEAGVNPFQASLFSKIVPNLKRLGLLTPRVRAEYAKLGLLRFETLKDSVEEPQVTPPAELVQLLMQFLQENARTGEAGQ